MAAKAVVELLPPPLLPPPLLPPPLLLLLLMECVVFAAGKMSRAVDATTAALSNIGSDLSVSISFSVANEFIEAARDAQFGDDELVAVLLVIVVAVTSIKGFVDAHAATARELASTRIRATASTDAISSGMQKSELDVHVEAAVRASDSSRGLLEFVSLVLSITQRITLSICVQVLAYSVKANQPSRIVRVTTLLGVVVFFVFFESAATRKVLS